MIPNHTRELAGREDRQSKIETWYPEATYSHEDRASSGRTNMSQRHISKPASMDGGDTQAEPELCSYTETGRPNDMIPALFLVEKLTMPRRART